MGVPVPETMTAEELTAESLLSSLRTIAAPERRKHASVYNYWLAIRRDREFPPIRDLDPLELSEAGPFSLLVEMVGGGEDAEIRHFGQAIRGGVDAEKVSEAPNPSLLSCIATRLPVVAACRDAFAFEDAFETTEGKTRCWVTLLPFSATGSWIDFVYGFVSLSPSNEAEEVPPDPAENAIEAVAEAPDPVASHPAEIAAEPEPQDVAPELGPAEESVTVALEEQTSDEAPQQGLRSETPSAGSGKAGFSGKFFEALASVGGFYGKPVEIELDHETVSLEMGEIHDDPWDSGETPEAIVEPASEPVEATVEQASAVSHSAEELADEVVTAEEPKVTVPPQSIATLEGSLHSKLSEVRAKADEARQAKLRANAALYAGLGAAYDFALDAEETPEEYLRLVEAEGLKIQLRSPMKPVAKLAFDGMCDELTIKQLEAILDWAFAEELPRGALAERIEEAGGIGPILRGQARAAA